MIEKLLEQKEKRDAEFRDECRENFRVLFQKLDRLEDRSSRLDGKLAIIVAAVSGGVSFLAKKLGIG